MRKREPRTPLWSDVLAAFLALLVINLLWNDPIGIATGGGWVALFAFNILPSALALFLVFRGRKTRGPGSAAISARRTVS
jgi:uncharacterized membrane protein